MKEVVLGLIQGLTEFLPVSSSGHLVLGQHLLGLSSPGIGLEVLLHLGTALAILVFFRRDIPLYFKFKGNPRENLLFLVVLGSVPAGIVGLLFADRIENLFESVKFVSAFLMVNGLFLIFTGLERGLKGEKISLPSPLKSLLIGIAQAFAILPGISRSGSTIGVGILLRLTPEASFRFSFLLALPAIVGASFLEFKRGEMVLRPVDLVAFLVSFLTGLFALFVLRRAVAGKKLPIFGIYTFLLGAMILILGIG